MTYGVRWYGSRSYGDSAKVSLFTAVIASLVLVPDGDLSSSNMIASTGGVLWNKVNDYTAETGTYIYNSGGLGTVTFSLTDVPVDFDYMQTLSLVLSVT